MGVILALRGVLALRVDATAEGSFNRSFRDALGQGGLFTAPRPNGHIFWSESGVGKPDKRTSIVSSL